LGHRLFIGLDGHNDSIAVSLVPSDSTKARRYGIIGGEYDDVLSCQKTGGCPSQRRLEVLLQSGAARLCSGPLAPGARGDCILVCSSKIPRKPGDRVKTDRPNADQLARLYRAGS
jgi:hypothetical protein